MSFQRYWSRDLIKRLPCYRIGALVLICVTEQPDSCIINTTTTPYLCASRAELVCANMTKPFFRVHFCREVESASRHAVRGGY